MDLEYLVVLSCEYGSQWETKGVNLEYLVVLSCEYGSQWETKVVNLEYLVVLSCEIWLPMGELEIGHFAKLS